MTNNVQIIMTSPAVQPHSTLVHKGHGAKGQPALIKALAGARYEIKDLVSLDKFAPPKIKLQRVGKDLRVWFEDEAQADAADALIAQGKAGPLTGIPIAHKDLFVTKDWQTTACSWPAAIAASTRRRCSTASEP